MRHPLTIGIAAWLALLLPGCGTHSRPVGPAPQLTEAQRNFEAVWQASREVLQRYRFALNRQDRRAGVITTRPMTGQYWLEFWRRDAVTPGSAAENFLQTTYRQAEITVSPAEPTGTGYQAGVKVHVSRSSRPIPQITNASEGPDLYSLPLSGPYRRNYVLIDETPGAPPPRSETVELGRDTALEAKLTRAIHAAARKRLARKE